MARSNDNNTDNFASKKKFQPGVIFMFANDDTSSSQCKYTYNLRKIDQHYALIITPLFDTQAPTCFGNHVPSSGSFLCPYALPEGRNGYVVCQVLGMLVACVHWLL
jgi:hypothetical protein